MRVRLLSWVLGVLWASVAVPAEPVRPEPVRVGAAASLREVIAELATAYRGAGGGEVSVSLGASGQLAAQVKAGAEIDVVIFASRREIAALAADGLVVADAVREVAGNRLVLVVPADTTAAPTSFADLAQVEGRVAIGEPRSVPAGAYARQVFEHLGLELGARLVYGTNVRQVLDLVERGEVAAGVVYATDAAGSGKVRVAAEAPAGSHDPVVYPAAVVATSNRRAEAKAFVAFLSSRQAREVFVRRGFSVPPSTMTRPADRPSGNDPGNPQGERTSGPDGGDAAGPHRRTPPPPTAADTPTSQTPSPSAPSSTRPAGVP